MCGILGIFNSEFEGQKLRNLALKLSRKIRHRGPDYNGLFVHNNNAIAHERLAIVSPESGHQPLISEDTNLILSANGEIYNHKELKKDLDYKFKTSSDCEVIIPLYLKYGPECVKYLDGMFAFIIFDKKNNVVFAARDHIGIIPLYIGYGTDGSTIIASEMKAITDICKQFEIFLPGYYNHNNKLVKWYNPKWENCSCLDLDLLKNTFIKSVKKRMMTDVPWGVLLSGGLDSSLVAAIASRSQSEKIHTFSIGVKGSPDLQAAKKVSDFLGTIHHSFEFTIQEGIDALRDVIYNIETYDITTIRSSVPMFLMARKIKSLGIKMVLSGEGSDEMFGGYLYFHKAPDAHEFHEETKLKLELLHFYDCLRANKSMSAFGVEPRVPFLDKSFLDFVMNLDPKHKMCVDSKGKPRIEKYILRKAFEGFLPDEILWRQKEQFSDGVGFNWIDSLKEYSNNHINHKQWENRHLYFSKNTPLTKEGFLYRKIFEEYFPQEAAIETVLQTASVACSTENAIKWDIAFQRIVDDTGGENSGRVIDVHNNVTN